MIQEDYIKQLEEENAKLREKLDECVATVESLKNDRDIEEWFYKAFVGEMVYAMRRYSKTKSMKVTQKLKKFVGDKFTSFFPIFGNSPKNQFIVATDSYYKEMEKDAEWDEYRGYVMEVIDNAKRLDKSRLSKIKILP